MENFELCEELAKKIYLSVYGHIDDKYFRASKCVEIYDWLVDGDQEYVKSASLEELCKEWKEYDI